jgi:hypothetical protein
MRELFVSHYIEHFWFVICVSILDAHPTNIQQSETTQQQEQTVKESQDNVEQKGKI